MTNPFLGQAARLLNADQSRVLLLTGNIHDLYFQDDADGGDYVPLPNLLQASWSVSKRIIITYELNGPIRFANDEDKAAMGQAWMRWRTGLEDNDLAIQRMLALGKQQNPSPSTTHQFDRQLQQSIGKPTVALELLRQLCCCSRQERDGQALLNRDLVIIIEATDLILPEGPITNLGDADRQRLHICHDWFADPGFMRADDAVLLLAESRSHIHSRISSLPQVLTVPIEEPHYQDRLRYITWFRRQLSSAERFPLEPNQDQELASATAGLSLQALRQLLRGGCYSGHLSQADILAKVEEYIQESLGDDVVSFAKPEHSLDDCVGFSNLKDFLINEFIPRCQMSGKAALPGAAISGPIGAGKTYLFEAVASHMQAPVLTLKNIRSKWFGGTDVLFERLKRVLTSLDRVVVFVDEADTQFGRIDAGAHDTERRLTGKIQALMSDPQLRGRVIWLLMTARIHLLSPDLRRPGRVGELTIPVLDPHTVADRDAFISWMLTGAHCTEPINDAMRVACADLSPASFAALRSECAAQAQLATSQLSQDQILDIIHNVLPADIAQVRRYQELQALLNCTRRQLLPDTSVNDADRLAWREELRQLELLGIS